MKISVKKIALMGLLLAMVTVLAYIEHLIPLDAVLPPNVKLGLSNIVTMFCVYCLGWREGLILAVLKSGFVFLTRGLVAFSLSLCGGVLSVLVLILLLFFFKEKISYLLASVLAAVAHNLGQFVAISLIMQSDLFVYYLPILLIFGVILGAITGIMLRVILPALKKLT